jgi:PadR family transcriptional regulator, regulatory protein PadR
MTVQTQLIVQALLKDPARELYGFELSAETGLLPGTAYPILLRLENEGWVTSRYYRLTAAGAAQARAAIAGARRPSGSALRRLAAEGGQA